MQSLLSAEVLQVLTDLEIDDLRVRIPYRLQSRTYKEVDEIFTRLGGIWTRQEQAHVFAETPTPLLAQVLQDRRLPPKPLANPTAFFPTPHTLVEELLMGYPFDRVPDGARLLEPSAGDGRIACALRAYFASHSLTPATIDCCEVLPRHRVTLSNLDFPLVGDDFLLYQPVEPYTAIVMNPPFSVPGQRHAYRNHMRHAWSMLAEEGVLIAVAPADYTVFEDAASRAFLQWILLYGEWDACEKGQFKESGTPIDTTVIRLIKREPSWQWLQPSNGWRSWNCDRLTMLANCDWEFYQQECRVLAQLTVGGLPHARNHADWPLTARYIRACYQQVLYRQRKTLYLQMQETDWRALEDHTIGAWKLEQEARTAFQTQLARSPDRVPVLSLAAPVPLSTEPLSIPQARRTKTLRRASRAKVAPSHYRQYTLEDLM